MTVPRLKKLKALLRRKEAIGLLVESLVDVVRIEIAGQVEVTKLDAAATLNAVKAKFDESLSTLDHLHREAPALIASANVAKNRALNVKGATGLSEAEALKKYDSARAVILKSHSQLVRLVERQEVEAEVAGEEPA